METRYITLTTRARGEERKVSGGGVLCQPRVESPSVKDGGKVLDLEAYRRRLELEQPAEEEAPELEPAVSPARTMTRREKLSVALDIVATVAVLAAAGGILLAMLGG